MAQQPACNDRRLRRHIALYPTALEQDVFVIRMLRVTIDRRTRAGNWRTGVAPLDLDRYDIVARFFHWVFAAGILYASVMGYALALTVHGPVHDFLSRLNMSIATVLIVLFPFRVIWKLLRIEPRALQGVPGWQRSLAHLVHNAIYLIIFAVLASGFLMVPNSYSFFGLIEIHTPFPKGPLTEEFFAVHRASCALLAGLVVLHVLAVVKHQLFSRSDVLRRMV
jgi:superoxide oxidase